MNKTEQRFEAAKAAMQGILSNSEMTRVLYGLANDLNITGDEAIIRRSRQVADALLAELARTEPAEHHIGDADKMVPDADGWVVRIPTDPIPEKHNG